MINLLMSGVFMLLLLSGCGWDGTPTRSSTDFIPVTSIEISADYSTIAAKTSTRLTVYASHMGLFKSDITDQVVWSSDTTNVSFISKNRVKGVTAGSAKLTATFGSIPASYTIAVSSATISTVAVTPATASAPKGRSQQFTAIGTFSDSTTQNITFDAAWTSSDPAVATLSAVVNSEGLATAVAASGTTTITATFDSMPGTAEMTDTAPVLDSITVTPANSSVLNLSKTVNFTATGMFSNLSTAVITSQVAWASSQPAVATIIANSGVATTVAAGTTSISAALNGVSGKTDLTVTNPVLIANGLKIDPATLVLSVGANNSKSFTVTATFIDGTTQNVTASSSWVSSNTIIATVSNSGVVTGNVAGSTTVTATYGNQSLSASITVL